MKRTAASQRAPAGRRVRGLSLIFALLALVALTLGAVALVRSVDTGVLALGNLAQKQSALVAAGRGTENAIAWTQNNMGAVLNADNNAQGYYASAMPRLDPTGRGASGGQADQLVRVDWDDNGCQVDGVAFPVANCITASSKVDVNGVEVRYVVHRLCLLPGAEGPGNPCAKPVTLGDAVSADKGGCAEGASCEDTAVPPDVGPYYRITARAKSARGTLTYTETLVNFQ
jgi:type IV pilus assembly protein PilX